MTAAQASSATGPSVGRVGRVGARAVVVACGACFLAGVVVWARSGSLLPLLSAMPATWSEQGLLRVLADAGVSAVLVGALHMLLELVVASSGLVAATLLLRPASTWFRIYAAVSIALWSTFGGGIADIYRRLVGGAAGDLMSMLQGIGWASVFVLAYLFPDGRFVPRWTRWCAVAWAVFLGGVGLLEAIGRPTDPRGMVETMPLLVLFGTAAWAAAYRYRRVSDEEERRQTRILVAAIVLWFALAAISILTPVGRLQDEMSIRGLLVNVVSQAVSYLIVALITISIALAVLRHRLYGVDVWINRALVYGTLTVFVAVLYAGVAAAGGLAWPSDGVAGSVLATVVVALALQPLRRRVQRGVERFVYGRRREPYGVLADLGRRLEQALPPDEVLRTLVQEVGVSLKLPYVVAEAGGLCVSHGTRPVPEGTELSFPLRWQDENLGLLTVVLARGDNLGEEESRLLETLAGQAGTAVRATTLNAELRASRDRLMVVRDLERRRLQRDLHDGLGPTLASLYQRIDAARSMVGSDPDAASSLLADTAKQTRAVVEEIRHIVRDLRPQELDDLGLVGAIRATASRFDAWEVEVADVVLPALRPAVEAAAYRIAAEAMTNAVKHADASTIRVAFRMEGETLWVEVIDDGRGLSEPQADGTGLRSMRDRVEEWGGTLSVGAAPQRGTLVRATLPLAGPS